MTSTGRRCGTRRPSRCRRRPTPSTGWKCTGSRTRSPDGPAAPPDSAATRFLFVSNGRVYRIDSDGEQAVPLTPEGQTALSPVWSPDGRTFAYTRLEGGRGGVILQSLAGGAAQVAPGAQSGLNITPAFAPDGRTLAFARSDETGTDIFTANFVDRCCAQRLTVGRFADNLSPTFSPDGRRIAFVSTRSGPPQIYVMAANGTDQELLAPFDYGATGASNAPEWSPDGARVVFHRDVSRQPADLPGRRRGPSRHPAHLVRPQRGSDVGPRRTPHRLHLRPHRTAADLDHRHRNRPGTAAPDARSGPASRVVPAPRPGHGRLEPMNSE